MEEDAEDIESLDPPPNHEEPWCYHRHGFTDYRRKWNTIQRADLDGSSYWKISRPHNRIQCEKPMLARFHLPEIGMVSQFLLGIDAGS